MVRALRQCLVVLIAFAFIGGTALQRARAAAPVMAAGMPCAMMMHHSGSHPAGPPAPCKGVGADCVKPCCVANLALPACPVAIGVAAVAIPVAYWAVWSPIAGFVREPEPLPPRTA